ncbi:MAG: PKD domain-containing protein, partial [Bacteroidetes bacterium]|nr:PKD domain-containing protein [Bacteroidota bacterium]
LANFVYSDSGLTVNFTDSSQNATTWLWNFGDGDTSILQNPTHTYDSAGTYIVCLGTGNSCGSDTSCDTLTVICILPIAYFTYTDSNLTFSFTNSSTNATIWFWDFGDGNTDTVQNPVHTYDSAGTYNVCLTAQNTCGSNTICNTLAVTCIPPKADFSFEDVLLSVMFSDSSDNATNWNWDFGDGDSDTLQNPVHIYADSGTYNVCLIAGSDCGKDSTCKLVKVIKIQLFIPSAFSPNGDGENDVFRVIGSGIKNIYLAIYNRWGERVFETNNVNQAMNIGWDGKHRGKEQSMAVFVYYVEVKFEDGINKTYKGDVTLIR